MNWNEWYDLYLDEKLIQREEQKEGNNKMTNKDMLDFIDNNVSYFKGPMTDFLLNVRQVIKVNEENEKVKLRLACFIHQSCLCRHCQTCRSSYMCESIFDTEETPNDMTPEEIVKAFEEV